MWAIFGRGRAFPDRLFDQIGERYLLSTLMFKPYNCCYLIHPAIQTFLTLCQTHDLSANNIKTAAVGLSKFSVSHAGTIIIPKDELGAQFSTSFTLALALIKEPPGMWSYTPETLVDSNIIALTKKITIYEDVEAEADFPKKNGCIVTIKTNKGKSFSLRLKDPKGSPENLLTPEEVKEKFMKNTTPIIGGTSSDKFYKKLSSFNELKSLQDLNKGIQPTAPSLVGN